MSGYVLNNKKDKSLIIIRLHDGEMKYKDGSKYEGSNPYIYLTGYVSL